MGVAVVPFAGQTVRSRKTASFEFIEALYPGGLQIAKHAHQKAYVGITISGNWNQEFGNQCRVGGPWTVTYHPPGEMHSNSFSNSGARILNINIALGRLRPLSARGLRLDTSIGVREGKAAWMARDIYREFCHSDDTTPLVLEGLTLQLLAELLRFATVNGSECLPPWLIKAKELVRSRFNEAIRLESIATAVGVHPVHLAREFRRHYRRTVGQEIRQLRIERACEELSRSKRPLVEIALGLGFADQSSFTKAFRRHTGLAPSQFRRLDRLR